MLDSGFDTQNNIQGNSQFTIDSSSILGNESSFIDKDLLGDSKEVGGILISTDLVNLDNSNHGNYVNDLSLELDITGKAVEQVQNLLTGLEADTALTDKLELAFGETFKAEIADKLVGNFGKDNFSEIPEIKIVSGDKVNGANGGYDSLNGIIYLSRDFVNTNQNDVNTITGVILEEVGHFIDSRINDVDAAGDEGELFSALVQGKTLSEAEIVAIKAEDDIDTITIDGQKIEIEYSQDYASRAKELWDSKTTDFSERDLAKTLQKEGATVEQIAQTLNSSVGFKLETIADALDNGTTFNYSDIAQGLWNSGHKIDAKKLADLLWDEGATEIEIGKALKHIGSDLSTTIDAFYGITKNDGTGINHNSVATGLWNSGHQIDAKKLADLLWDKGATEIEVGKALNNIGLDLATIANALDDGITKSDGTGLDSNSVATGLWNSGHAISTRKLADLLWDEGIYSTEIAKALKHLGFSLPTIADALDDGVTTSSGNGIGYISAATGLWNSGHPIDARKLADLLWDEGASASKIGRTLKYLGFDLPTIADALDDGVTLKDGTGLDYANVATGLWKSGHKIDSRKLADLMWQEVMLPSEIGKALNHVVGRNPIQIASDMRYGISGVDFKSENSLFYKHLATALWNSGHKLNTRQLADLLWDRGASQAQIGKAFKYLGFGLTTIADAVADGVTKSDGQGLNYSSVATALWKSGHKTGTREIARLLRYEGASAGQIGKAIKNLGFGLTTIADALDDGAGFNYTTVAKGLWSSGHKINSRKLADLLWDEGASQGEIAQALNYGIGRSLSGIASDMKYGVTLSNGKSFNYIDVAIGLWNSGHKVSTRNIALELQKLGASAVDNARALNYGLGSNLRTIADALDDGATYSYGQVADGLWKSGHGINSGNLAKLLRDEGAGYWTVVGALKSAAGHSHLGAIGIATKGEISDFIHDAAKQVKAVGNKVEKLYDDSKSLSGISKTLDSAIETVKNTAKDVEKAVTDDVVDILKKVPVVGTAVGAIEGVINAVQGDEKGVLKSAIDSALAFYGGSNVITPKMVDFVVDVFWELKDSDYKGAVSESLNNLGVSKTASELFVSVAWAMEKGNWENAVDAALSTVGFDNAQEFVDIAWGVIDKNYQGALEAGLDLVGFDSLNIDQAKADTFIKVAVAVKDGNYNQVADHLIALAGNDAQKYLNTDWIKDLRDENVAKARQAIEQGLSELGFDKVTQWADTIWAVKEGQYLDALSDVLTLGQFEDAQEWSKIIDDLKAENYLEALTTAFNLADFEDGKSLAEAAIAVKEGNLIEAFYESFDLIEGGSDLKDAFKAIQEFDLQDFITSMVDALPLLIKLA
ncbi:hypothetical protein NIES267_10800 [Calothrix parasitica NIES-267]|uniref:Uncharacterized protein n=1 Tax=Calothrix parasitica NIES-267 TaxID=1973488 RepID=A0A1Z4LK29_9CYAN|nr:hypothetical protein NIES267_10800 [Calothrix parasitica NIES-267]